MTGIDTVCIEIISRCPLRCVHCSANASPERIERLSRADNQCLSLVCSGLNQDGSGAWVPGACASKKALGDSCMQNYQCASSYCDSGNNTSRTDRCMPNTNGMSGDICSHNNQCASRNCVGLHASGNQWIPGTCQ
jgi:hypothetical protein